MEQLTVTSRIIQSVYFSQEDRRLRVCFKNGEQRLFTDVPPEEAIAMVNAASPGQHYIDNVRTRFRRLAA